MSEPKKPSRSGAQGKPANADTKRRRIDWEAIERDYRAGQFSLRELEKKHGATYANISRRAKKDGWTQDLQGAVRQATSAALIAKLATAKATEGQQKTTDVVLAAAEVNKGVLLTHVAEWDRTRQLANTLLDEIAHQSVKPEVLEGLLERLNDDADDATKDQARKALREALKVGNRVAAAQKLADTFTKIQAGERKALNLDDPAEQPKPPAPSLADLQPGEEVDAYRAWVNG